MNERSQGISGRFGLAHESEADRRFASWRRSALFVAIAGGEHAPLLAFACWAVYGGLCLTDRSRSRKPYASWALLPTVVLLAFAWSRAADPWGYGWHKFVHNGQYPSTVVDLTLAALMWWVVGPSVRRAEIRVAFWALLATLPLQALLATLQIWGPVEGGVLEPWRIGNLPIVRLRLLKARPFTLAGGFPNRNVFGAFLVLCFLSARFLEQSSAARWQRRASTAARYVALVLLLLCGSRTAIVVAVLILVGFELKASRAAVAKLGRLLVWPIALALLVLGLTRADDPDLYWSKLTRTQTLGHRGRMFGCAFDLLEESPLLGLGHGTMAVECETRLGERVNHAHNLFVQLAVDLGLPLGLGLSALLILAWLHAWRNTRTGREADSVRAAGAVAGAAFLLSQMALPILHSFQLELFCFWCTTVFIASGRPTVRLLVTTERVTRPPHPATGQTA